MLLLELIINVIAFLDNRRKPYPGDEWEDEVPNFGKWGRSSLSLASCSLVCHRWNDLCRPYLGCRKGDARRGKGWRSPRRGEDDNTNYTVST